MTEKMTTLDQRYEKIVQFATTTAKDQCFFKEYRDPENNLLNVAINAAVFKQNCKGDEDYFDAIKQLSDRLIKYFHIDEEQLLGPESDKVLSRLARWRPASLCTKRFTSDSKLEVLSHENGIFTAQVTNGTFNFTGTGQTIQLAKEDAAIRFFKHEKIEPVFVKFLEAISKGSNTDPRQISLIMTDENPVPSNVSEEHYKKFMALKKQRFTKVALAKVPGDEEQYAAMVAITCRGDSKNDASSKILKNLEGKGSRRYGAKTTPDGEPVPRKRKHRAGKKVKEREAKRAKKIGDSKKLAAGWMMNP